MLTALERAANGRWLMDSAALETVLEIADRQGNPEALEAKLGKRLDNARSVTLRDGIAVIPISGPIFRYANLFTRISGATSTEVLATDLQAALDDPKVKAIVLNIDSPGGEATGINELADMVYAARTKKPIKAYVGGMGASAAYWIASAASELVIDDTALIGSIGVVLEVAVNKTDDGKKRYSILSRNAPNKRPDIETEQGRSAIAQSIDALEDVFIARVARNLGVSVEDVPSMGDYGGVRVGAAAVKAGLAHRLGSLESLITELAKASTPARIFHMTTVRTTAELQAALAAGVDPSSIKISEAVMGEVINLQPLPSAEDLAQAKADERARIQGIQALATQGFEKEVTHAIDSGMSVEAAALSLFKAHQERGISLDGIKTDAQGTLGASPTHNAASQDRKAAAGFIAAGAQQRR